MIWSVNTLATHLLGEFGQDRNATGGTVPERWKAIVREALRSVWEDYDWYWQRVIFTLTTAAGGASIQFDEEFRKLDSRWLRDNEERGGSLVFTNSVRAWQEHFDSYKDDDRGKPALACVVRDRSVTTYMGYKAMLAPVADDAYSYDVWALTKCPTSLSASHAHARTDAEALIMPDKWHEGWRLRARMKLLPSFSDDDKAVARAAVDYRNWKVEALDEHNEQITDSIEPFRDGYHDLDSMAGAGMSGSDDPSVRLPDAMG